MQEYREEVRQVALHLQTQGVVLTQKPIAPYMTQPGEPQLWVTAFEAVAGLVIEGVFIAMLTQKFFGK